MSKTLPEILEQFHILDTSHLYHHEHDADKLNVAIAKELMGCLPEKRLSQGNGTIGPPLDPNISYNQALDEVRARLTAFIGKDSNENS